MKDSDRVRRVAILCCHCVRNIAFYRGGANLRESWKSNDFWRNANSNFLDKAVLEWCKLFADPGGKHYWSKVVPPSEDFMESVYQASGSSEEIFSKYIEKMKTYRDKFLAHLDDDNVMHFPDLEIAILSTICLNNLIASKFPDYDSGAPRDLLKFYEGRLAYARKQYKIGCLKHH